MNRIQLGWGRREISIDKPVSIPGQMYVRVSQGILDPLYATALCVDSGEENGQVIFCSLDITVMRGGIMDMVLEATVKKEPEIKAEWLLLNATHTHSSCHMTHQPEKSKDGREIYPSELWKEYAVGQISDAIVEAYHNRKEGGIAYGYGYAVVGHSRRSTYLTDHGAGKVPGLTSNGYAVMYGSTKAVDFAGYEAGADHFVNLMYTFNAENKLTGIVINVPCPSQTSEHFEKLSADYWNEVRELVKKEYGEDVYVLTQCAAAGDLSPRILHYGKAQARRMKLKYGLEYEVGKCAMGTPGNIIKAMGERYDIAERIMTAVKEVYGWASKDIQTELKVEHAYKVLDLPRRVPTEHEIAVAKNAIENIPYEDFLAMQMKSQGITELDAREEAKMKDRFNSFTNRNKAVLDRAEDVKTDPTLPMRMHVLHIGDIAFASNRFELYMDFMHRMQARSPYLQTFVIQLAGEQNGSYLPTSRAAANLGYGSSVYENQFGPDAGEMIVEETLKSLNEMKEKEL